jgi:hypothetical protein
MARWLTKCAGDKNNLQRSRAVECIVLDRPRNPRPRAISLFGLFPPCQPGMAQCLNMDSRPAEPPCSCAALNSAARTPYHQSNPFESQTRTWMRGGPAETPLYGRSWPFDNQTSWSHDWPGTETTVRRHCLSLLLHSIVLPSFTPRSSTPQPSLLSSLYSRLTILLCTTSLPCWHDYTVTIVIRHNHQRDQASRYSTFFPRTS